MKGPGSRQPKPRPAHRPAPPATTNAIVLGGLKP
jgi:hypothetical protein